MKKFLGLFIGLLISTLSAFSADMRFIQVEGVFYSTQDKKSQEKLETIVNKINNEKNVDFVVFTGNNIANPNPKNLEAFLNTTKILKKPYYVVIGNKDVNKQKDLSKNEYMKIVRKNLRTHKKIESANYVFEKNKQIFIVVDGAKEVIPSSIGYYKKEVLDWLESQLKIYGDKNVIIIQHFPLIPPIAKESHYTYKANEYLKLLAKYPNVKAVISGHFGVNNEKVFNGILHITTQNAPVYRVIDIMDYETKNPTLWSTIKE